jgi:mannosyltransferase OCH1-like enzyme
MPFIPKIIHQTWKDLSVPEHWKPSQEAWKAYHPDWEYRLWTDDDLRNLIRDDYPEFLKIYDSYPHTIQRVDSARYFILKKFGGVYSDLDIQPNLPFDHLLDSGKVVLVASPNAKLFTNAIMASQPEDPFWDHVIALMIERAKNPSKLWIGKHLTVFNTTGPLLLTKAFQTYDKPITVLPTGTNKCGLCCEKPCSSPGSPVTLLKGGSWESWDTKLLNFVLCKWKIILFFLVLIIVLFFLKFWEYRRISKIFRSHTCVSVLPLSPLGFTVESLSKV